MLVLVGLVVVPRWRPRRHSLDRRCSAVQGRSGARCGSIRRLLDPADPAAGTIKVSFEVHRATERPRNPAGTIVAVEGGPGYATTASRGYYLDLFAPLLDTRHCCSSTTAAPAGRRDRLPGLQSYQGDYVRNVASRAASNSRRNADVYGTAFAADDLAAVLDRLGIEQVDLYGDSYGSSSARRSPSGIPIGCAPSCSTPPTRWRPEPVVPGPEPGHGQGLPPGVPARPRPPAIGGDPIARMRRLADALAAHPLTGRAPTADGEVQRVTLDAPMLSYLAAVATYTTPVYRELDAAGRASSGTVTRSRCCGSPPSRTCPATPGR